MQQEFATKLAGRRSASPSSSRALREQIVGKCISGVIARPGRDGQPPTVLVLQFEDGTTLEFVSPRSDRLLRAALSGSRRAAPRASEPLPGQLALAVV